MPHLHRHCLRPSRRQHHTTLQPSQTTLVLRNGSKDVGTRRVLAGRLHVEASTGETTHPTCTNVLLGAGWKSQQLQIPATLQCCQCHVCAARGPSWRSACFWRNPPVQHCAVDLRLLAYHENCCVPICTSRLLPLDCCTSPPPLSSMSAPWQIELRARPDIIVSPRHERTAPNQREPNKYYQPINKMARQLHASDVDVRVASTKTSSTPSVLPLSTMALVESPNGSLKILHKGLLVSPD